MNYQLIYDQLCKRGQERVLESYTEKHHIVPRCIGGSNEVSNLTDLTWREHQLAHKLLTKIFPENVKLARAANMMKASTKESRLAMSTRGNGRSLRRTAISEQEKLALSKRMKENNPNAAGLMGRKPVKVTCIETGKEYLFDGLNEAERQMKTITGLTINHTSVYLNMQKNRPYKKYLWSFI